MTKPEPLVMLHQARCVAGGRTLLQLPSWALHAGERVAIVGHNGAGKSTLIKLLTGFMPPASGTVQVLGHALHQPLSPARLRALRSEVGQVLQGLHLVGRLSAQDNVLLGALGRMGQAGGWNAWRSCLRWFPPHEVALARQALERVGMAAHAHTRADRLSGGEKQKTALARLLMQRPRLILADEPTAALDPAAATEVCQLLAGAAAATGATLVTVVHNTALLPLLADRVVGLSQGQLVFDMPVGQVTETQLASLYRPEPFQEPAHA
ncbi:MAG: ATP-binding cassette domain-containing protein [Serpentinimonas sp.]|nr:ATP-binding cassette domain-containing protein [Serpentinimonas sp.]